MAGIFSRFSIGRTAPRRTQSALNIDAGGGLVPSRPNRDADSTACCTVIDLREPVPGNTVITVTASHGNEVVHEFKPIEHPAEPLNNDLPVQCPLSEPSILDDGRIWKERVTAGMRLRAELPVTEGETTPPSPETGDKKLLPFQPNRLIMPSLSAPEHDILTLLEEINASGI